MYEIIPIKKKSQFQMEIDGGFAPGVTTSQYGYAPIIEPFYVSPMKRKFLAQNRF